MCVGGGEGVERISMRQHASNEQKKNFNDSVGGTIYMQPLNHACMSGLICQYIPNHNYNLYRGM